MKKIFCILLLAISSSYADYIVTGVGDSKAEAYLNAITRAPSGSHWILSKISYYPAFGGRHECNITWKDK